MESKSDKQIFYESAALALTGGFLEAGREIVEHGINGSAVIWLYGGMLSAAGLVAYTRLHE